MLEQYHRKTFIPLILFGTGLSSETNKLREKTISAVNSILKIQLGLSGQVLQAIFYMIDEFTQNIVDHSKSQKGVLFAQFYPSKNYMDVCIADSGQGLYQSYVTSGKHQPKGHKEALNFAIYGRSTKDRSDSRGFGISTSRKMLVEGLKGKFFIYSGTSFYSELVDQQQLTDLSANNFMNGTYIALRIPVLDNKQFNFYDFVE